MEKDFNQVFNELKDDISTYAELKFELLKLNTYEKAGRVVSLLSYGLVLALLLFLATLFLFLALGFLLGQWLQSDSAGIAIVGGIYVIMIAILVWKREWFKDKILNIVIHALATNDDKTSDDHTNETDYEGSANSAGETDI